MNKEKPDTADPGELRRRAEERLGVYSDSTVSEQRTGPETQRLVHELQVHQVELELQNEELQRSRAEVEEALARFADLYEFAPVAYLTLGRDGEIKQINLTGVRLLGHERSRLMGRRFGLLVGPESRAAFDAFFGKVLASQTREVCEVVVPVEASAPLSLELAGTTTDDGQECRVVAMDISARKRAESEREALRAQLAQAQRMEAIGTLAGGIAHNFNNILFGVLGGLSLLELDLEEAGQHHHQEIQAMTAQVDRGAALVKQLLAFARRGKYDVKPLDLARVVNDTSAMFGNTRKDITLQLELAPDLRAVLMDHSQLEQVLLNLFINAGQAMPEGGRLTLRAQNAELSSAQVAPHGAAPGHFVKLVVEDTGIGIDAATRAHIFEPFFSLKGFGEGSGLGLASVYGILKSHSGFITVDSEPGKGTTFTLHLPATDRPAVEEKVAASIPRGTGTVLVVDDEEQVLKVCAKLLERMGYEVLTASSGRQALEVVRQNRERISLVLLDMVMPDMSGRQSYDALQQVAPGIKVLLCSGYSVDGQAQVILAHGCNGFIQKPFDALALSAKVREILQADKPSG